MWAWPNEKKRKKVKRVKDGQSGQVHEWKGERDVGTRLEPLHSKRTGSELVDMPPLTLSLFLSLSLRWEVHLTTDLIHTQAWRWPMEKGSGCPRKNNTYLFQDCKMSAIASALSTPPTPSLLQMFVIYLHIVVLKVALFRQKQLSHDQRQNAQHAIKPLNSYGGSIEALKTWQQRQAWCSAQQKIKPSLVPSGFKLFELWPFLVCPVTSLLYMKQAYAT